MLVEVAKYLSACPELEGRQVCINHLAENEESVSLEVSGSRDSVMEYADGGVMRGVTFILSIRDDFGVSQPESCDIARRCAKIEKWVEEQNLMGNLPVLEGSAKSVSLGVARCFEIVSTRDFLARYEMQIELIYYNPA